MKLTTNYGLKKPEGTDVVNIDDFNDNADVLDAKVKNLEDVVTETKKSVSDGKTLLAAAITAKRVAAAATDTFAQLAAKIGQIILGSGNATAADVLASKTFTNSTGVEQIGTMVNRGAVSQALNAGGSYSVPSGYHNGSGTVTANSLASQTSATAIASQILVGNTAWVNGIRITGTMANYATTPTAIDALRINNGRIEVAVVAGYHGYSWANGGYEYITYAQMASLISLTAAKLIPGNTILGITSNVATFGAQTITPGATAQTVLTSGKFGTGNITVAARPAGWYDSATQQTVFNYGSYGNAANMGAFYTNSTYVWSSDATRPAVMNEANSMYLGGTNPTYRVIFRQAFPLEWKWAYINWFTGVSNRSITIFVINPSTMLSVGSRVFTVTTPNTGGNGAYIDLSTYVSQCTNGWFLGFAGDFSNMVSYGLRTVILGPTQPVL